MIFFSVVSTADKIVLTFNLMRSVTEPTLAKPRKYHRNKPQKHAATLQQTNISL